MVTAENNRPLTGHVTDSSADILPEGTFNDRDAGQVDDGLNVYRWALACERQKPSRSIASEFVAHVSTL